ncbi:hypothetical protein JJB07_19295 [Tumebacillus sp. ITR2]|uniref:HPr kinase/phosphorylase C-terminal domain-containing protein n=1 Tax=Tumebacillus amylolyticus TaxID=2801339 RepID=A0ABS1JEN8_9BACL|nr:hypothetical protein [Tumebacillus amylolyticus]MBL0388750.1 hypothetical protein [Tumebacillus amylolyticus]
MIQTTQHVFDTLTTQPTPHTLEVSYANSSVLLRTHCPEIVEQTLHRLIPYFRFGEATPEQLQQLDTVWVCRDAKLYRQALDSLPSEYSLVPIPSQYEGGSFTDGRLYDLDGSLLFHYQTNGVLVYSDRVRRQTVLLGDDTSHLAIEARAILKDNLLQRMEEANGSVIFHSSAVSFDGKGFLVVGRKGAGKTTTLTGALLRKEDASFVSNDFVMLDSANRLHGWPEPIGISDFTCKLFDMSPEQTEGLRTSKGKLIIPYRDIPSRLHVMIAPSVELQAVVLPTSDFTQPSGFYEVDPVEARAILEAECRTPHDPSRPHWLQYVEVDESALVEQAQKRIDDLLRCPLIGLRIGHDFSEMARSLFTKLTARSSL